MVRKYLANSFFFVAGGLLCVAQSATAEVACVADVSYRWLKEGSQGGQEALALAEAKPPAAGSAAPAAPSAGATSPPASPGHQRDAQPVEQRVRFATIERRGKDEAAVKAGLLIEVNRQKARAHERCRRDHESFGDCVSTKMSTRASTLNSLSFSARSKVEEALIEECKLQQGRCVSIDSGEPTCRAVAAETAPPETAVAASGEGAEAPKEEATGSKAGEKEGKAAEPAADKAKSAKKKP